MFGGTSGALYDASGARPRYTDGALYGGGPRSHYPRGMPAVRGRGRMSLDRGQPLARDTNGLFGPAVGAHDSTPLDHRGYGGQLHGGPHACSPLVDAISMALGRPAPQLNLHSSTPISDVARCTFRNIAADSPPGSIHAEVADAAVHALHIAGTVTPHSHVIHALTFLFPTTSTTRDWHPYIAVERIIIDATRYDDPIASLLDWLRRCFLGIYAGAVNRAGGSTKNSLDQALHEGRQLTLSLLADLVRADATGGARAQREMFLLQDLRRPQPAGVDLGSHYAEYKRVLAQLGRMGCTPAESDIIGTFITTVHGEQLRRTLAAAVADRRFAGALRRSAHTLGQHY